MSKTKTDVVHRCFDVGPPEKAPRRRKTIPVCHFAIDDFFRDTCWTLTVGSGTHETWVCGEVENKRTAYRSARRWAKRCLAPAVRKRALAAIDKAAREASVK